MLSTKRVVYPVVVTNAEENEVAERLSTTEVIGRRRIADHEQVVNLIHTKPDVLEVVKKKMAIRFVIFQRNKGRHMWYN